jgi:fatty-acyl-CoA synthase
VGGLCIQVLPALYAGASVTLMPRFEPDQVLRTLAAARPTLTLTVPATLRALQKHARWAETDLSSLKLIMTGSMNTPDSLIQACHARGVPVGQVYGSTETAPVAICLGREDALAHVGSTGKPVAHVEVRLVTADGREADSGEPGEVWVRGPNVMKEYWRAPEATRANFVDGWFRTGDVARRDDAGFYTICGRTREVIISGGENIYPAELENVLLDSPAIAEAAVIGMPDPQWGEAPVACVVRAAGAAIDEAQVMALFSGRIARYKHPRRVVFVDALPRTALGKVQRGVLRAQLDALDGGADSGRNASPAAGSNGAP